MTSKAEANPSQVPRPGLGRVDMHFADLGDVPIIDQGWEYSLCQLSRGALGFSIRRIEVVGLILEWIHLDAAMAVHETKLTSDLTLVVPLEYSSETSFGGQSVAFGHVGLLSRGIDFCHRTQPGLYSLSITVPRKLADRMGWMEDPKTALWTKVSRDVLRGILSRLENAVRLLEMRSEVDLCETVLAELFRAIGDLLEPLSRAQDQNALSQTTLRNMALLTAVQKHLLKSDWVGSTDISELATKLGVSQRTLFRAFAASIGMAPRAYQKRLRLQMVRESLRCADDNSASVTEVAMDHGFWHLGRFSQEFREAFGHSPSQARIAPAPSQNRE